MSPHIVFITAGEWPARRGLLVSQVLETARALHRKGHTVSWIAVIPLLSQIKRWVLRDGDLKWLQAECKANNIDFEHRIIPVTLGTPWSFGTRKWWHYRTAERSIRRILDLSESTKAIVLHARSYYAAEIAIFMRELIDSNSRAFTTITSFDMRSMLGPESPMSHGAAGTALYGFIKELEFSLVRDSDVSFLPVDIARFNYLDETGLAIQYAPIQGFDREPDWKINFDVRWSNRQIGYSGSVGQWNDPDLLLAMFRLFSDFKPNVASEKINTFSQIECKLYDQHELPKYYDGLLALVIPGLTDIDGYFCTVKMRSNFFSTKAAEALSRGVPLVVSAELEELAAFVRKHDCGIVIELANGQPVLQSGLEIHSRDLWLRLCSNAANIGKSFERRTVIEHYEAAWQAAINRRRNPTTFAIQAKGDTE